MLPLAPPTFSITTVWPSGARIASPMMRAAVSVEPPGGNGTIRETGRVGNGWAAALAASADSAMAAKKLFIYPPLSGGERRRPFLEPLGGHKQAAAGADDEVSLLDGV